MLFYSLCILSVVLVAFPGDSVAQITCPPMPVAVTEVNRDVRSNINASVASLGKVKAGDVASKTEITVKNLFEKYPNVDQLLTVQTMAATYCALLRDAKSLTDKEKVDRWELFQDKVLKIQPKPQKKNPPTTAVKNKKAKVKEAPTEKKVPRDSVAKGLPGEALQYLSDFSPKVDFKYAETESGQIKDKSKTNRINHYLSNVGKYPLEVTGYKVYVTSNAFNDDNDAKMELIEGTDYTLGKHSTFTGILPPMTSKPFSLTVSLTDVAYKKYPTVQVTEYVYYKTQQFFINQLKTKYKDVISEKDLLSILSGRERYTINIHLQRSGTSQELEREK